MQSASWLDSAPQSVFGAIDDRLRERDAARIACLHQGKTYFTPCVTPANWTRDEFPLLAHEHAAPGGVRDLRGQASDYLKARQRRLVDPADIVITNGASHAVFTIFNSVLEPGDEVLVLSPQWLFAVGLVHAARGRAVEVPVFLELAADRGFDLAGALEAACTDRTRALYFNTPNNPTGVCLGPAELQVVVNFAERHGLWIVADQAYENYDFTDVGFTDIAALAGAAERTFSVYTFSKTFAMPGYRVGFVAAPAGWAGRLTTAGLYSVYSVATFAQRAASAALATPAAELDSRRALAAAACRTAMATLRVPHTPVAGGLYAFLDLRACAGGTADFIDRCIEAGLTLAPGAAFGARYASYARLCFTAVEPPSLRRALAALNRTYLGRTM